MKILSIFFLLLLSILLCTTLHSFFGYCIIFLVGSFLLFGPYTTPSRRKYIGVILLYVVIYVATTKYSFYQDSIKLGCGQPGQGMDRGVAITGALEFVAFRATLATMHGRLLIGQTTMNTYQPGQLLSLEGSISCLSLYPQPFSYDMQLYLQGYMGSIQVRSIQKLSAIDTVHPPIATVPGNSTSLFPTIDLPRPYSGIPEGIVYGVTTNIDRTVYKQFIQSGLVYVLSASGGNISLFLGILMVLCRGVSLRKRRYIIISIIALYAYMLRTNVALMRAFLSFAYVFILSSYGARISRIHLFCFVLLLYTLYNPYLLISSRGLVLSCAGVWGLIHIPIVLQKKSLVHTCSAALRTFIALAGPLLFLTHTANILTIVLSPFAGLLAMLITRTSLALTVFPFLDYIGLTKLLFYEVKSLCSLAEFGSSHGIFITSQDQPIIILLCVWIGLRSIQRHTMIALNRHYYANIRD